MKNYTIIYFSKDLDMNDLKLYLSRLLLTDENKLIIFLKRNSKSILDNDNISKIYKKIIDYLVEYDIFYLSNYQDSCEKSVVIDDWKGLKIEETFSPNGFEAIASTHKKWLKIYKLLESQKDNNISKKLNTLIFKNKIKALTTWPRIYQSDKNKNYCRNEKNIEVEEINNLSRFYFFISLILFIIFCIKNYFY